MSRVRKKTLELIEGVRGLLEGKEFTVNTDSVILSVGYKPAPVAPKAKEETVEE